MPPFQVISFQSLDEQTTLSGWMFPAKGEPVSTVIMVHDNGSNRLQFGIDMPALYDFFVEAHYNVLSFDLRHAGKSEGQLSAFGYAEWEDVLAAINYARQFTTTKDVLLYGFGSGVTSALFAWSRLPERAASAATANDTAETIAKDDAGSAAERAMSQRIAALGFDQSYIRGVLLDTPCVSPDNYIQAVYRHGGLLGRILLQFTVPYAVRLSASSSSQRSLVTILTRIQRPVFISYSDQDNWVGRQSIVPLVNERLRLHPDTTTVYVDPEPGYVSGIKNNQGAYLGALQDYLSRYIG
jgi:pimeloyl-ACP methyl ester carboxylesterase